ncbi:MFS transporter [Haloplasma contractile]|uniref:Tetracycline resistance determinant tetV protein n=1 Tax=Haloplasma contractile SSD-17B TaxID=1033810 RepID=F7Q140_9MOLU|nr:MFS transporter [Haloplasma contractile]ERJ11319.1 Tetracycline resistance determinant tetV protein [Haloplasma contractile SSD-17B]
MKKSTEISNMILLLTGKVVSLFGSYIYSFAISLYVLKVTGSALNFGLSFALGVFPRVIFGPVSGVITDRFNRKRLIVMLDLLSGIIVLSLMGLSFADELRIGYIYVTTFLLATCSTFFNTALSSSIPNVVSEKNLTRVNSLSEASASIAAITGPFVGGIVYALIDIRLFLLVNGLSFIVSGLSELFIKFNVHKPVDIEKEVQVQTEKWSFFTDLKEGIDYMKQEKWLLVLGAFVIFFNLFTIMGLTVPIPYIVVELWKFSEFEYSLLNIMFPVGMLVASLVLSVLPQAKSNYKRLIICILVFSVGIFLVGVVTSEKIFQLSNLYYLIILMGMYLTMAIASIFINVPIGVTMQKLVPNEMLGRVQGVLGTLAQGLSPIGAIIGGLLVDRINPWILPMTCGVIMILLTFAMTRVKEIRAI